MTAEQKWDELVERMDEVIASGEVVSGADARDVVKRRHPHLADAEYPGSIGITSSQSRPGVTAGTASAETRTRPACAGTRRAGSDLVRAGVRAGLNADASLYLRYLQQHEAALGARRG